MEKFPNRSDTSLIDVPEEVLSNIINYLSLSERCNISSTCRHLYDAFKHPQSWQTLELATSRRYDENFQQTITYCPEQYNSIISKYGTYIKTIRIIMSDVLTDFKGLERILAILSQKCRPEKILLKFSSIWSYTCRYVLKGDSPPIDQIMLLIGSFFESIDSSRLKSILIDSWPRTKETSIAATFVTTLMNIQNIIDIEHLLLWPSPLQQPNNGLASCTLQLINHFAHLTAIGLNVSMLTNELIGHLSKSQRSKLKTIKIRITDIRSVSEEINPFSWELFTNINPHVRLEFTVIDSVTNQDLDKVLSPCCLLSKIMFNETARCDVRMINSLVSKYYKSLETFIVYCDLADCDIELIMMVRKCKLLHTMIIGLSSNNCCYQGTINFKTLEKMAIIHGKTWNIFQFHESIISFVDRMNIEQDNSFDTVASMDSRGFYLKNLQRFHNEPTGDERRQKCTTLLESILRLGFNIRCGSIISTKTIDET